MCFDNVWRRMSTHPRVAGAMVPKREMVEFYQRLADAGFGDIEEFDQFMEPRKDLLKKAVTTSTMEERIARHDWDYWYAARSFLYEWNGWSEPIYLKKPYLRRAWELHCQDAASSDFIAKLITHEGVMEGTGYRISAQSVKLHLQKLRKELQEWIRVKQYFNIIGE